MWPAIEELNDTGPSVTITVNSFRSWADREGYTLEPGFTRRETTPLLSQRLAAEIHVPVVCLAVYADDTLEWVVPRADGKRTYTVEGCLSALERGVVDPLDRQINASQDRPVSRSVYESERQAVAEPDPQSVDESENVE